MASKNRLRFGGLLLLFFARFLTTTVPGQGVLAAVFLVKPKLPARLWAYLLVVATYWAVVVVLHPSVVPLKNLLFYFGFVLPAIVIISAKPPNAFIFVSDKFILLMCSLVLLEAFILNTSLAGYLSFLLPANWSTSGENVVLFGYYQRPLGFAGNASMTSGVLIFSMVLSDVRRQIFGNDPKNGASNRDTRRSRVGGRFEYRTLAVAAAVLALASGAGFGLLLLYAAWRGVRRIELRPRSVAKAAVILAVPILGIVGAFKYLNDIQGFNKFSSVYAVNIFDLKKEALTESLRDRPGGLGVTLLGDQILSNTLNPATSDDFGLVTMYKTIGIVGTLCLLGVPFLFSAAWMGLAGLTIFFFATFIHYPGLLSPPGAVLFALYLYLLFRQESVVVSQARRSVSRDFRLQPLRVSD